MFTETGDTIALLGFALVSSAVIVLALSLAAPPTATHGWPIAETEGGCVTPAPRRRIVRKSALIRRHAVSGSKKKRKTFHASLQVTRIEDWCVQAESAEQARALLASGEGERCRIGDCVFVEVGDVSE